MPYVDLTTTAAVSPDKAAALKAGFGKAIESFPGKTENWLMVRISGDEKLWFRGDDSADSAMVDVHLFGTVSAGESDKMTAAVTELLGCELGIAPDRIYIKYSGYEYWGWNGRNF